MPDLMTDVYNYNQLTNKYGNFFQPIVEIKVNGVNVMASMGFMVEELTLDLSLTAAGSSCIKIGNIYNEVNRSFNQTVVNKFKPGTIVEIALGYYSATVTVLKGFVYMLGAEFGARNLLVVTIMDVRRLMMSSGSKHVLHNVKNYSDAFKNVMSAYSKLCTPKVTATDDKLKSPISQTGTDYDFVMQELVNKGKSDREFFVVADKAYFRERPKTGTSMMKLEQGHELLMVQMDYTYLDMGIQVMGYNSFEQKAYTGKAQAKSSEPQSSLISPSPTWIISDPEADNQEKATRRAQYIADTEKEQAKSGKIVTIGLPEIVPGRFIEIVKVEAMVNRKYYISGVKHKLGNSMFTTEIEIGGWC